MNLSHNRLRQLYRLLATALLVVFALYAVLGLIPFLTNGLHLLPAEIVAGNRGLFAPRALWPFHLPGIGDTLYNLAVPVTVFAPFVATALVITFTASMWLRWPEMERRQRRSSLALTAFGLFIMAVMLSTFGQVIWSWLLD